MNLPLKLIIDKKSGVRGYETNEVRDYMKSIGRLEEWGNFFNGQTGAIIGKKFIIYSWDIERFLQNKPNTD